MGAFEAVLYFSKEGLDWLLDKRETPRVVFDSPFLPHIRNELTVLFDSDFRDDDDHNIERSDFIIDDVRFIGVGEIKPFDKKGPFLAMVEVSCAEIRRFCKTGSNDEFTVNWWRKQNGDRELGQIMYYQGEKAQQIYNKEKDIDKTEEFGIFKASLQKKEKQ